MFLLQSICEGKLHIYVDKQFLEKKTTLIKKIVGVHDVRKQNA